MVDHVAVLRQMLTTGAVSDWRALDAALEVAIAALSAPEASEARKIGTITGTYSAEYSMALLPIADAPIGTDLYTINPAPPTSGDSPTEKVRSLFERCASTLVGAEYAQGYREALDHVDAARRERGE